MTDRSTFSRYAVAVIATFAALMLRVFLQSWLGASSPFLFFTLAVMLSAWYGGLGPGILATLAGAGLINIFLLEPLGTFTLKADHAGRMVLFLVVGTQISWLSGAMYTARRRAESDAQAARRSERLYRMLASNFPDGFVCLFDDHFRWTLVAGAGLTQAQLSREGMEGLPIAATLPPDTAAQVQALCADAVAGKVSTRDIIHNDRVYFTQALPLRTQDESAHVAMIIFEDVTERVRAREALQQAHDQLEQRVLQRTAELRFQRTLMESQIQASADGILAADIDGRIIFANRRFGDIWALSAESGVSADSLRRLMRKQQLDSAQLDPLSADSAQFAVVEQQRSDQLLLKDGRSIERYSAPILGSDGKCYGRVWFFRDITERKRMQREILEAGERERQHVGQDLHDDLCQQLAGIACIGRAFQLQLSKRAHPDAAADTATASEIVQMLQQANARARDLARGLQPLYLRQRGLVTALQELCANISAMFQTSCSFEGDLTGTTVDEPVSLQLYRICQEAISNAVRHGKSHQVRVELAAQNGRLVLSVEDDGCGIPQPLPQDGLGLYTMNYRAQMIGGMLTVEPRQPCGTIVTCSVPHLSASAQPEADFAGALSEVREGS